MLDYNLDDADFDDDGEENGITLMAAARPSETFNCSEDEYDDEGDCAVNVADDIMSLSVISKSINTSYINLKRHNPLQNPLTNRRRPDVDLRDVCPERINLS